MAEPVRYHLEDGVTWLVIDRPEVRNAINRAVGAGLWDGFRRFEADPAAKVAVLTGTGDAFCAGADLK
jgi:enoyl-CoA hydratase/carnithine racemase